MPEGIRAITDDSVTVVDPTGQSRTNSVRPTPRRLVRRMSPARPMCGDIPQSGPGERSNFPSKSMVCRWTGRHGRRIDTPHLYGNRDRRSQAETRSLLGLPADHGPAGLWSISTLAEAAP